MMNDQSVEQRKKWQEGVFRTPQENWLPEIKPKSLKAKISRSWCGWYFGVTGKLLTVMVPRQEGSCDRVTARCRLRILDKEFVRFYENETTMQLEQFTIEWMSVA